MTTVWKKIEQEKIAQPDNKKQEIIRKPDKSIQESEWGDENHYFQ